MDQLVKLSSINKDTRQRKFFDEMKIVELADSILAHGLLHAVVLRKDVDDLVAGDRRSRAVELIYRKGLTFSYNGVEVPPGFIPVTRVSPADELQFREMELHENIQREDLTWQEESEAHAELHRLRQLQTNGTQTLEQTARELKGERPFSGTDTTALSTDILIADNLGDEDIAKAKSKKEALKILQHKKQKEKNEQLAEKFNLNSQLDHRHQLTHGNAIVELHNMTPEHFDVIITDPPYGVGAHTFGDQTLINHEYDDSFESWQKIMVPFAHESFRVAAAQSHAYVFCDIRNWPTLAEMFREAGWYVWSRPLIWDKGNVGTLPRPQHGPRLCYEAILYAIKGDKETTKVAHDVIRIPATAKPRHAAEKPVDLYVELLSRSVKPGDKIIDPFCGSGPVFPAANRLHLTATGIELEQANIGIASERLEEK